MTPLAAAIMAVACLVVPLAVRIARRELANVEASLRLMEELDRG